jgi:hypothetical protein
MEQIKHKDHNISKKPMRLIIALSNDVSQKISQKAELSLNFNRLNYERENRKPLTKITSDYTAMDYNN